MKPILVFLIVWTYGCSANEELKKWFKEVNDVKYDCSDFGAGVDQSEEIFKTVDCNEDGARFDYKYQTKGGKKTKRGAPFNGHSVLSFHSSFNDGVRTGKCLKPYRDDVLSISGKFINNKLEGHVLIELAENKVTVGHATKNRIMGVVRNFLLKMPDGHVMQDISTVSGKLIYQVSQDGYFRIVTTNKTTNSKDTRVILTKNFDKFINCEPISHLVMKDCFLDTVSKITIENCYPSTIDLPNKNNNAENKFLFEIANNKSFYPSREDPYKVCREETKSENIRNSIENWMANMSNPKMNPFWMINYPDINPIDLSNPKVDLSFPHLRGHLFDKQLNLSIINDANDVLFKGKVINGRLKGTIDPKMRDPKLWRGTLRLVSSVQTGAVSSGKKILNFHLDVELVHAVFQLKNGKFHGYVRMFGQTTVDPKGLCSHYVWERVFGFVGRYDEGKAVGVAWRGLFGGSWLHGKVDENGEFTGNDIAYVYSDMKTSFVGEFENGLMMNGQEAEVIGNHCEDGIMVLEFSKPNGPVFHYDPMTENSLGDQPLERDPLDKRYVYLKESETFPLAGEGTYAKEFIPAKTVFVLYGGHIMNNTQMNKLIKTQTGHFDKLGVPPKHPDRLDTWKYRHTIAMCGLSIDLPGKYESIDSFKSTLGHKVNHKFIPTSSYMHVDSARFGVINALITNVDIAKDEELFANYGYPATVGLDWYRDAYRNFARERPELANQKMLEKLAELEEKEAKGEVTGITEPVSMGEVDKEDDENKV